MGWVHSTQGRTKNKYKILVGNPAGRRPLWNPRVDLNGNLDGGFRLDIPALGRDILLAVVSMVMKRGHLNCQLLQQKSALCSYTTWPWKYRCKTWRHAQHVPEHVAGRQGHTRRYQQCPQVSNKDSLSGIFRVASRFPPVQDWDSATTRMLTAILSLLIPIARKHNRVVLTVTRILEFCLTSSWRSPSVRTVTACFVAQYMA